MLCTQIPPTSTPSIELRALTLTLQDFQVPSKPPENALLQPSARSSPPSTSTVPGAQSLLVLGLFPAPTTLCSVKPAACKRGSDGTLLLAGPPGLVPGNTLKDHTLGFTVLDQGRTAYCRVLWRPLEEALLAFLGPAPNQPPTWAPPP